MKTYVRCDGCRQEGQPVPLSPTATGQVWGPAAIGGATLSSQGLYWVQPVGWTEYAGYVLCEKCSAKVAQVVKAMVEGGRGSLEDASGITNVMLGHTGGYIPRGSR